MADRTSPATFPSLRTPRLCLRRFRASDAEPFAAYRSVPDVARYQGWEAPYPVEEARQFVATMATAPVDVPGEWIQIAVALPDSGLLVGDCAFVPLAQEPRTVEIGFTIAPEYQGQGYATEAVRELLRYLFDTLHKHRVRASCDPLNLPSRRVLEKLGLRQENSPLDAAGSQHDWTDDLVFVALRRDWARSL
jgi:RimJ/RimL family protein N-acetyltransferase